MVSLLDIAPPEILAEEVNIRGTMLPVRGVSGEQWVTLYRRFPDLRAIVGGTAADADISAVQSFAAQSSVIAAGLGKLGDAETERLIMERLSRDDRRLLLDKILELSLPGDVFRPLLQDETAAAAPLPGVGSPQEPDPVSR